MPKLKTWHYTIKAHSSEWALIVLRSDGFFAAVSTYGNYAHLWSNSGYKDFREFFLITDSGYFIQKLKSGTEVQPEASCQALLGDVVKSRRSKDISSKAARDIYDLVIGYEGDWEGVIRDPDVTAIYSEPWGFQVKAPPRDVIAFCQVMLPKLSELIEKELNPKKKRINPTTL